MKSFSERIGLILEHYQLQPKDLAEKCGVQRSAISHLINGRNRPSVTFLSTLSSLYPELDTRWLLHGKGSMFTNVSQDTTSKSETTVNKEFVTHKQNDTDDTSVNNLPETDLKEMDPIRISSKTNVDQIDTNKAIERIIVCYTDGTFDTYHPKAN